MDIYSKPTDSERYVSFILNYPKQCLKNIPFSLARKICMIAEKDSLKEIKFKELEKIVLEQYYPERTIKAGINKALKDSLKEIKLKELKKIPQEQYYPERIIKAGINKALKIPQNELRNVKELEKKIFPFISTFNSTNPKDLPIIKQTLENLKTLDHMRNALKRVKLTSN